MAMDVGRAELNDHAIVAAEAAKACPGEACPRVKPEGMLAGDML